MIEMQIIIGVSGAILVMLAFVAFGQKRVNARINEMQNNTMSDRIRIDHIERDVHDLKEGQQAISAGYNKQYADIAGIIKESLEPMGRRLERIEDKLMGGK